MTEQIPPVAEYHAVPNQSTFLVSKTDYDLHGRPLFQKRLGSRPSGVGARFTIVHAVNDKPSRSYDIAIVEQQKADMHKPLAVLYEWTGRGFEGGLAVSEGIFPGGGTMSGREAAAFLAIKAAPVVIGSVTGFVFGLAAGIPATAAVLRNVVVNTREMLIGYTLYEYDEKGRLKFMKLYPPIDHTAELVKTEFFYSNASGEPMQAEVTSIVEQKKRMIKN